MMALPPEAREAHARLSRHAASLASVSASFATEALAVADAYAQALTGSCDGSWAAFVAAAAMVADHSASVASILHFSERERAAAEFFDQIVRENADLLTALGAEEFA